MPKLNNNLEQVKLPVGNYGYTATRIDALTATEYTVVTLVQDESGTTSPFRALLETAIKEIVKACRHSPRADNLMLRLVSFGTKLREVHGFKLLEACNVDDYTGCYVDGGSTALFDSAHNAIEATMHYAANLTKNDFLCNGIVFVLTDGDDNASTYNTSHVRDALAKCIQSESMESLISVLIGVNIADPHMKQRLDDFSQSAGFSKFMALEDASEKSIAKLVEFVSRSISSQSQALGTGGPSKDIQSMTF